MKSIANCLFVILLATSAPTNVNSVTGDAAKNILPAVGNPKGWIIVSGTGWVSEGNL